MLYIIGFIILLGAGILIKSIGGHEESNTASSHQIKEQETEKAYDALETKENRESTDANSHSSAIEQKSSTPKYKSSERTARANPCIQANAVVQSSDAARPSATSRSSISAQPIVAAQTDAAARQSTQRDIVRIVLLTDSGKFGGACVSGYDPQTRKFVRFVSDAATGKEISFSELRGITPMDIITAEKAQECPLGPQSENVLIKPGACGVSADTMER